MCVTSASRWEVEPLRAMRVRTVLVLFQKNLPEAVAVERQVCTLSTNVFSVSCCIRSRTAAWAVGVEGKPPRENKTINGIKRDSTMEF